MLRHAATAAFLLAALAARPSFADVTGQAAVVDGDTLDVAGERVRLQGIDAHELHQTCTAYGQEWACGRISADWLRDRLQGQQVDCVGHARDRYAIPNIAHIRPPEPLFYLWPGSHIEPLVVISCLRKAIRRADERLRRFAVTSTA